MKVLPCRWNGSGRIQDLCGLPLEWRPTRVTIGTSVPIKRIPRFVASVKSFSMASLHIFCVLRRDNAPWFSGGESRGALDRLRQHRAIRQEVSDRIFAPIQSLENEGILYVFLVFQTEEVGQKDGGDSQTQLCGVALTYKNHDRLTVPQTASGGGRSAFWGNGW